MLNNIQNSSTFQYFVQAILLNPFVKTTCFQEGSDLNYECTVNDTTNIGSTIWLGDMFQCVESSNQIRLVHSKYETGQVGVCGNFSAVSVRVNGSAFTSRLSIHSVTSNQITMINCTLAGVILVETIIVITAG